MSVDCKLAILTKLKQLKTGLPVLLLLYITGPRIPAFGFDATRFTMPHRSLSTGKHTIYPQSELYPSTRHHQ